MVLNTTKYEKYCSLKQLQQFQKINFFAKKGLTAFGMSFTIESKPTHNFIWNIIKRDRGTGPMTSSNPQHELGRC
ncbi:hypothetical protein HNQ44_001434 [Planomicrobium koreense]|uniref:Uncharacterized protein n=1 Tax=Planococcus koreensis TaxID=112331 RepID=A0A7W8FTY6_9BACL|nr:hypothetical protein [Planococcus koreensis]